MPYPISCIPKSRPASASFAPTDIVGLQLWLKADAGLFKDAAKAQPATAADDLVYTWADQSGNGNDAVQATEANRPVLKLAQQNGLNVVLCGGSNYFNTAFRFGAAHTVFLVCYYTSYSGALISARNTSSVTPIAGHLDLNGAGNPRYLVDDDAGHLANATASSAYREEWLLLEGHRNGNSIWVFRNGSQIATDTATLGTITSDTCQVGAMCEGGPINNYITGSMAELLVYNAYLSGDNMGKVRTYLNSRWAIY